jgi:hypothetical protein
MAIQDDFTINPKSKVIRHKSGTTVYTVTAFYSYLMDAFDEPGYLSYEAPMKFNTPTSFTMLNGWFLDNGDAGSNDTGNILQYLKGGGIDTLNYSSIADPVYMVDLTSEVAALVAADKDKDVRTNDTDTQGPLLAFKANYPDATSARAWYRDVNSIGLPAGGEDFDIVSGTGDYTGSTTVSGDEIYHNPFTLASFPGTPDPQVYMYQDHPVSGGTRARIAEWSGLADNWDRGSIDVLIPVQLGGSLIDSGNISTFVRQTGDSFTFAESTFATAGRTPIAVETLSDTVNVVKGEHYLLYDTSNTGSFTAGDIIQDQSTAASATPPSWYAEVVAVTEFASTTEGVLTLRGLRGSISNNDAIYVGTTQEALANGTPGDTYTTYTAESVAMTTLGQTVTGGTSTATRLLAGIQDDGTTGALVLEVDTSLTGTARNVNYKDFTTGETLTGSTEGSLTHVTASSTTLVSGYDDITVAFMNGTIPVNTFSGTFLFGETVDVTGGGTFTMIETDGSASMSIGNVTSETNLNVATTVLTGQTSGATCQIVTTAGMTDINTENKAFTQQSAFDYSVFIQGGDLYEAGRSLTDIYTYLQFYLRDGQTTTLYTSTGAAIVPINAEEYIKGDAAYTATKPAPFGTLAGGVFFGAQGVWVEGMSATDDNNIKLTDDTGAAQSPTPSVNVVISNTRVDDRIAVFLDDGTGLPDKTQYSSKTTVNAQGDSTFEANITFPVDTPTSGSFFVVDDSANEEHRYRYSSFATDTLTMPTASAGTVTAGTAANTLVDSAADFGGADDVVVGDIVRRTNNEGGWCYVTSVDSTTQLTTTNFNNNITAAWDDTATADDYTINTLVELYTTSDNMFIPYMDFIETTGTDGTPGSETQSLLYLGDRAVVIVARNSENTLYEIVPFKTTSNITSTGMNASVIRNEDTVFVP